ncbi:MAG: hypothetical protein IPJ65_42790 [Archangiaceae bacterium]|nr:hypothetical protein [Archangiaceae bacterium]
MPFVKTVRDEWFVSGTEAVTPDANARIPMPNSVASTIRLITWNNNGTPIPLVRIEPENAFMYQGNNASNQPYGYMLKAYEIQVLPTNIGSVSVRIDFMERPAQMVLEEDAGLIASHVGLALTLDSVPLAWQSETPSTVDIISNESPFVAVASDVTVVSLVGSVLTLSGIDSALVENGFWVSDVGTSPYPNVPIEFHPLLQRSVISELYAGTGDKRLDSSMKLQAKLESELRSTMSPRTQGSARPIVNKSGPGMRNFARWW